MVLVRRMRITQVEMRQEICSLLETLDMLISKYGCGSSCVDRSELVVAEEVALPIGEMKAFDELEKKLHSKEPQKKFVGNELHFYTL